MLRHAFTVVRGVEQAIDNGSECLGVRPRILHERFHFFRLRRQADEIKRRTTDQRQAICCRCDGESGGHFRRDEGVDRIAGSVGRRGLLDGLIGPESLGLVLSVCPLRREPAACLHDDAILRRPL